MKYFFLLGSLLLPVAAFAHDGHADAPAPATEFVHYLSPTHILPVVLAVIMGAVIGRVIATRSRERSHNE